MNGHALQPLGKIVKAHWSWIMMILSQVSEWPSSIKLFHRKKNCTDRVCHKFRRNCVTLLQQGHWPHWNFKVTLNFRGTWPLTVIGVMFTVSTQLTRWVSPGNLAVLYMVTWLNILELMTSLHYRKPCHIHVLVYFHEKYKSLIFISLQILSLCIDLYYHASFALTTCVCCLPGM